MTAWEPFDLGVQQARQDGPAPTSAVREAARLLQKVAERVAAAHLAPLEEHSSDQLEHLRRVVNQDNRSDEQGPDAA